MTALTGLTSLAVDTAHVRLVHTQLQGAADAAVRAGAAVLGSNPTVVQNAIVAQAAANSADGKSVVVDPTNDIDFGTWSNGTFTVVNGTAQWTATALRVRCVRTAARGNPVSVFFGSLLSRTSSDLIIAATATGTPNQAAGIIGLNGITTDVNAYYGGYKSSNTTSPSSTSCDSNMSVGSNSFIDGTVTGRGTVCCTLYGNTLLGSGATVQNISVYGNNTSTSGISSPTVPTWSPGTNPNSISQAYTVNSQITIPGGTYWFTSLTLNATLSFSGTTVIYVNGPIVFSNTGTTIQPSSKIPSDLTIYQYSGNTFSSGTTNNITIYGKVIAPGCDFSTVDHFQLFGGAIFKTIKTGTC